MRLSTNVGYAVASVRGDRSIDARLCGLILISISSDRQWLGFALLFPSGDEDHDDNAKDQCTDWVAHCQVVMSAGDVYHNSDQSDDHVNTPLF